MPLRDSVRSIGLCVLYAGVLGVRCLNAQTPPPPEDVLILNDDERLVGHLVRAAGGSLTFKSNVLGNITTDWKNVKELHTRTPYAVLGKDVQVRPHADGSTVPQGTLDVTGQTITVNPGAGAAPRSVPVAQAAQVIEQPAFEQQISPPSISIFKDWAGTITAGASVVVATQQSRTFTGAVNLIRAIPQETAFPARNRTSIDFTFADGYELQPGTPRIKTEIYHADAERDQYFSISRVYAFGQAAFDHNFSQGLDLQQNYDGGIGWTVINAPNVTFDIKGSIGYVRQNFAQSSKDQDLIASNFSERVLRRFTRGITFTEQITATPTWNDLNALLVQGNAALNVPVYKRFAFTLGVIESFLRDPSPGFKKNSFQATAGLSYTVR